MVQKFTAFIDAYNVARTLAFGIKEVQSVVDVSHEVYYESFDGTGVVNKTYTISLGKILDGTYFDLISKAAEELGKALDTNTSLCTATRVKNIQHFVVTM